jgi:hypothetical protein
MSILGRFVVLCCSYHSVGNRSAVCAMETRLYASSYRFAIRWFGTVGSRVQYMKHVHRPFPHPQSFSFFQDFLISLWVGHSRARSWPPMAHSGQVGE